MKKYLLFLLLIPFFADGQALFNTLYFNSPQRRVGVGVMVPSCKMDIDATEYLRIRNLTANGSDSLLVKTAGGFIYYRLASTIAGSYDSCLWRLNGTTVYPKSYIARNVGIGTSTATQKLEVNGSIINSACTGTGLYSLALGYHTSVTNDYSVALGYNSSATGYIAIAVGGGTIASGQNSFSSGAISTASGDVSTAMGSHTIASANTSSAFGRYTKATGIYTTAMGNYINAKGKGSFAIGLNYNRPVKDTIQADSTMAIMGGNVGIGITAPTAKLDINGNLKIRNVTNNGSDSILVKSGHTVYYRMAGTISDDSTLWRLWSAGKIAQKDLTTNVGIGTAAPLQKLDVNGKVKIRDVASSVSDSVLVKTGGGVVYYRLAGGIADDSTLWRKWVANKIAPKTITDSVGIGLANPNNLIQVKNLINFNGSNTYIGDHVGYLDVLPTTENTAVGYYSLYYNTGGYGNTAFGYCAALSNTKGSNNVAIGNIALYYDTTGNENIAIGWASMMFKVRGDSNIAIGSQALYNNTTGSKNIAIGAEALYHNITGSGNVAIGNYVASWELGSNKLYIDNTNSVNPLIWGDFVNDYVSVNGRLGINNYAPSYAVDVTGQINSSTGFSKSGTVFIDASGYLVPKTSTDAAAPNNSIYYSSTASKLVYKDGGGSVNALY